MTGCQTSGACEGEGYKVESDACVAKVGTDCTGTFGFESGKCVPASTVKHCTDRGAFVLNKAMTGCQTSGACEGEGYKVESDACVAKVWGDCISGEQGFANGKCVVKPQDAGHCQAVGKVLQFDMEGCQPSDACTTSGYKVRASACVAKVPGDCTGAQGFENGMCIEPTTVQHCKNRSSDFILDLAKTGCQSEDACNRTGHVVEFDTCVVKLCTGTQGYDSDSGQCIRPTTGQHCRNRGDFILNIKVNEGCQRPAQCTAAGYKIKVVSHACVAKVGTDCSGTEGLAAGRCVAPTEAVHCTNRGAYILNVNLDSCQTQTECTTAGYRVMGGSCVGMNIASDCTGEQGFQDGVCIAQPTDPMPCQRIDKVLQLDGVGCVKTQACLSDGYKLSAMQTQCMKQTGDSCRDVNERDGLFYRRSNAIPGGLIDGEGLTRGLIDGRCTTDVTTNKHCQDLYGNAVVHPEGKGCIGKRACEIAGYRYASDRDDSLANSCSFQLAERCTTGESFSQGRCVDRPVVPGIASCLIRTVRLGLMGSSDINDFPFPLVCRSQDACASGNQDACEIYKRLVPQPVCQAGMVLVVGGTCAEAASVCATNQVALYDVCASNQNCPEGWGVDTANRACVETPSPAQCGGVDDRIFDSLTDTAQCTTTAQCSRRGFKVATMGGQQTCVKKVASDCTARTFDTGDGRCVTTPLSSPEAVDASFDDAFHSLKTRPINFCIVGSGTMADSMLSVSNTITDDTTCHHDDLDTTEKMRQAFADTEDVLGAKKIAEGSLIAFTSASSQLAFADNGLNLSVLSGYKVFIPTGDSGLANFLDDSAYSTMAKARIHAALHFGDAFAVGRLNAAGEWASCQQ